MDLAPSFLGAAGIDTPFSMTGVDQHPVWCGAQREARDHVVVENRHQPTTIHMKTYVDKRHKLTVYFNRDYGELFDLRSDPDEVNNLWDSEAHQTLKCELMVKLLHADMANESMPMPRIGPE